MRLMHILGGPFLSLLFATLVSTPLVARADTVASLLGNFTINQYCDVKLGDDTVDVHFVVVFGQLPALRELRLADANRDGVTSQEERDAYVSQLAPGFAEQLKVTVNGAAVPLRAVRWTTSLPAEQGGFSMRLDIDYSGALASNRRDGISALRFANENYAGRIGWHEIAVHAPPTVKVFDTNAFSTSMTSGLTEALQTLPASGPLDERTVHLRFTRGAAPLDARLLAPRPGEVAAVSSAPATPTSDGNTSGWLQRQTRQLVNLISTPQVAPHVALLALLAAMVLGALHAFSPGHGKTIVGAYLIGSRSTPRHAIFLGVTVTVTHTLVVFAVGLATLFASRFILPERLFPILSLLSGLLVSGMGIVLLTQRWRGARDVLVRFLRGRHKRLSTLSTEATTGASPEGVPARSFRYGAPLLAGQSAMGLRWGLAPTHGNAHRNDGHDHHHGSGPGHHHHAHNHNHHAHGHGHDHGHDHAQGPGHDHAHDPTGLMHSHGGTMHSHLPPGAAGEQVSWRSLLALGVSGGLVPCPSAMVLLLAAVALNKTFYGLLMVVAFSVGLALTLIAVGMAFLYARNRFRRPLSTAGWPHVLPALSAVLITIIGLVLCYGALTSAGFGPGLT